MALCAPTVCAVCEHLRYVRHAVVEAARPRPDAPDRPAATRVVWCWHTPE